MSIVQINQLVTSMYFFQRTDLLKNNLLDIVVLTLLREEELIPADILDNKKTKIVYIQYDGPQGLVGLLKVDANAFQRTKNYT